MRTPVVALLVLAIAGVGAFGIWSNRDDRPPRFCQASAFVMGPVDGMEGFSVTLQDHPGPSHCDGSDRPERDDPAPAGADGPPAPGAGPTTTVAPEVTAPADEPVVHLEPLVLGLDCRYRDVDGEVVAEAVPNLPGRRCGIPHGGGGEPGRLAGPVSRAPR